MLTMDDVRRETAKFFERHWDSVKLGVNEIPAWSELYGLQGGVPNGDKQGCYALLEDEEVIYVGLGAGRGAGNYKECGIGSRLNKYLVVDKKQRTAPVATRQYTPNEAWKEMTGLHTIGFPKGYGYLACGLESFLLANLKPCKNTNRPGSSSGND